MQSKSEEEVFSESNIVKKLAEIDLRLNTIRAVAAESQNRQELAVLDAATFAIDIARAHFYKMEREQLKKDLLWLHDFLTDPNQLENLGGLIAAKRLFHDIVKVL